MPALTKEAAATTEATGKDKDNDPKQLKRKRKPKDTTAATTFHSLSPTWAYLHLSLLIARPDTHIDALTLRSCLLKAMSTYLGDHGAAIPIDILHISEDVLHSGVRRPSTYIRVPNDNAQAVIAGVASFTGSASVLSISVKAHSAWLAMLSAENDGQELFEMTAENNAATMAAG
jgi:ribonuclease P/MRP protein subunit POP8